MAASHTPGPWSRNVSPATNYPVVFAGRNTHIAAISDDGRISAEQAEANLNLITAAPDLLMAGQHLAVKLAEVYRAAGVDPRLCEAIQDWLVVTAKAEGR